MNVIPLSGLKDWLVEHLEFSLFIRLDKTELPISRHEVRFVPNNFFLKGEPLAAILKKGTSSEDIIDPDGSDAVMIIALVGSFFSTDLFKLKSFMADSAGIQVWLSYINVENQDGDPVPVVPHLIIPVNHSLKKYKKLTIEFEGLKRHFLTGQELKDPTINIPKFEFLFS
jgi:hypothetical protein